MKKSLVITGIKHSGKSSLGQMLAQRTNCAWHDLDDLVQHRPENAQWLSIRELYKAKGKDYFQEQEKLAVKEYIDRFNPGTKCAILSLGGGTIENQGVMDFISQKAMIIYLALDEEVLYQRILYKGLPPFLSPEDPRGDFHRLFLQRDALNRRWANEIIELKDQSKEENLDLIYQTLLTFSGNIEE
ncbi:MAG: hypothetical protein PF447_11930 [Spirochaetaceae bacterium]|jgi:shikimate kinase|nr:hypothetical protein [Spirochaetaceae bacterium]